MKQRSAYIDNDLYKKITEIVLNETGNSRGFSKVVNEALRDWLAKKIGAPDEKGEINIAGEMCVRMEKRLLEPVKGPRDNDLEHVREIVKASLSDPEITGLWEAAKRGDEDRDDVYKRLLAKKREKANGV